MPILHLTVPPNLRDQIRSAAHDAGQRIDEWVIGALQSRLDTLRHVAQAGARGGRATARALTAEQRSARARRAAQGRWGTRDGE